MTGVAAPHALKALQDAFAPLAALGYDGPAIEAVDDPLTGAFHRLTYVSPAAQRRIEIDYFARIDKGRPELLGKPLAIVFVENEDGGIFSLGGWIKHRAIGDAPGHRGLPDKDIPAFAAEVLSLFEGPLAEVISGERWERVPIDWGPYK